MIKIMEKSHNGSTKEVDKETGKNEEKIEEKRNIK